MRCASGSAALSSALCEVRDDVRATVSSSKSLTFTADGVRGRGVPGVLNERGEGRGDDVMMGCAGVYEVGD